MTVTSKQVAALAAVLIVAGAAGLPGQARAQTSGGAALKATMSGPAETPPGDPQGAGTATLKVDAAKGQVCYELQVSHIATPTMAHIHKGAAGVAGPVAIPLKTPDATGKSAGCAPADAAVLSAIVHDPSGYYVNVHNGPYPAGAVRGQLTQ